MRRLPRLVLYGAVPVALTLALVALRAAVADEDTATRPSYAQLVAKNYRVLTAAESRTLVRYAGRVHECLIAHGGGGVARPVPSSTRIEMRAPAESARSLVRLLTACDPIVGPPPPNTSLQARPGEIVLFLPKQCLLDPREVDAGRTET